MDDKVKKEWDIEVCANTECPKFNQIFYGYECCDRCGEPLKKTDIPELDEKKYLDCQKDIMRGIRINMICSGCENNVEICSCESLLEGVTVYMFSFLTDDRQGYIKKEEVVKLIAGWREAFSIVGAKDVHVKTMGT